MIKRIAEITGRLSKTAREKGALGMLEHVRYALTYRLQFALLDKRLGKAEAVDTTPMAELANLTIDSDNRDVGLHYQPSPRKLIHWAHELLPADHANWSFIDLGAGRGRVVLDAATYPYRQVLGIEFAEELQADGVENIRQTPKELIKAESVDILHADAATFAIPAGPCIFYLFNPFQDVVLRPFLEHVIASHQENPRPFIFVYLNPIHVDVFGEFPQLRRSPLPLPTAFKFALLSPYKIVMYSLGHTPPVC